MVNLEWSSYGKSWLVHASPQQNSRNAQSHRSISLPNIQRNSMLHGHVTVSSKF
jgi:hypothetical protein